MCRELAARGVTLLEADTDGVYFAVPEAWSEADERRVVAEVAALLPPLVQLEFDGRYAAMLSHEPKNYALLGYDGTLMLRGVAFRSSRAEPFGEAFLRRALARLLAGDVAGVRDAYLATRGCAAPPRAADARRVVARAADQDAGASTRETRETPPRAAVRGAAGERPHVVARRRARARLPHAGRRGRPWSRIRRRGADRGADPRDYDVDHYVRVLRDTFATRLARAFTPEDFAAVFADPDQLSLFAPPIAAMRPVLVTRPG